MTVGELMDELDCFSEDTEVRVVQQPNYPLVADIKEWGPVELNKGTVYIHLAEAYDYFQPEEDEDFEEDEEDDS